MGAMNAGTDRLSKDTKKGIRKCGNVMEVNPGNGLYELNELDTYSDGSNNMTREILSFMAQCD